MTEYEVAGQILAGIIGITAGGVYLWLASTYNWWPYD